MELVIITVRDINGKRSRISGIQYEIMGKLLEAQESGTCDEYEILSVTVDGCCMYSALANDGITFEDLIGFFA